MNKMIIGFFLSALLSGVQAVEMDHSKMMHDNEAVLPTLKKLEVVPASGKAREGGADGRYVMESISVDDSLAARCAKASRGLMMLDNAAWERCGGKPQGIPMTPAALGLNKEMPKAGRASKEHAGHKMP